MSPEQIGALGAVVVAMLSTAATLSSTRNNRLVKSEKDLSKENRRLVHLYEVALKYIVRLRRFLIARGHTPPKAPPELELDADEEEVADDDT